MKSVGEAMAIGRTFKEAFMKAFRSLELGTTASLSASRTRPTTIQPTSEDDGALQRELASRPTAGCGRCSARSSAAGRSSRSTS